MQRVIVVGGGLAGLAAASALGRRGFHVELFESRPRLGGRASSFFDSASGQQIDACQHVSLGCCTNLAEFCRHMNVAHLFRREKVLYFVAPDGRVSPLSASRLPAPLHLAPGFLRSGLLRGADKWRVARGLAQLCLRFGNHRQPTCAAQASSHVTEQPARSGAQHHCVGDPEPSARIPSDRVRSFADWLNERGQTAQAIERFWALILTSALSEQLCRIDVAQARKVFTDAFLAHPQAWEMLIPTVPLGELYGDRLLQALGREGVHVQLNQAVRHVCVEGGKVTSLELREGTHASAPWFVLAAPPDRVLAMLPPALVEQYSYFHELRRLIRAPITSVHLWFDRPITSLPHAVIVGRTSQWLFNRTALQPGNGVGAGAAPQGSTHYYQVVISASHTLATLGKQRILQLVQEDLSQIFPKSRPAKLQHARVVTEHAAVFSAEPGREQARPVQSSPLENLFIAGDWTRTGWPATMEGAVRSGYLAAEALLERCGRKEAIVCPDLPRRGLARWLLSS